LSNKAVKAIAFIIFPFGFHFFLVIVSSIIHVLPFVVRLKVNEFYFGFQCEEFIDKVSISEIKELIDKYQKK
jgi:hypothetical protein